MTTPPPRHPGMTDDLGGGYAALCEGPDATPAMLAECQCLVEVTLVGGMHRAVYRAWHPLCPRHRGMGR